MYKKIETRGRYLAGTGDDCFALSPWSAKTLLMPMLTLLMVAFWRSSGDGGYSDAIVSVWVMNGDGLIFVREVPNDAFG